MGSRLASQKLLFRVAFRRGVRNVEVLLNQRLQMNASTGLGKPWMIAQCSYSVVRHGSERRFRDGDNSTVIDVAEHVQRSLVDSFRNKVGNATFRVCRLIPTSKLLQKDSGFSPCDN